MSFSEWVVRNITYPLHERARGYDTMGLLGDLARLVQSPKPYVDDYIRHQMREQLRYCAARLPFYTEWFARHGVDVKAYDPVAELNKLPVLTKAMINEQSERMQNRNVEGGVKTSCTGGTTGDRLEFLVDHVHGAQGLAARFLMQGQFGVRPGDKRAYLWGSPIELSTARIKSLRDRLLNEILLNAFDMGPQDMDAHIKRIQNFHPKLMYGYPSALARLAQYAAGQWGPKDFRFLKVIVATGEELTPDQKTQISSVFGCPVVMEYGSREFGVIAHECPHGHLHIMTPNVHVSIRDKKQPVGVGKVGEVVATLLNTKAQPLVNYRLGDLGRLVEGTCECGLPLPMMTVESGKVLGFIALPDGRLCNGAVTSHILRPLKGIVHYKTHQKTTTDFDIYLVTNSDFEQDTVQYVQRRYREMFGDSVNVNCHLVDKIPVDKSGKQRYVMSDVATDYTSFDVVSEEEVLSQA